jgi:cellulose synthase/poly-beta-1,6-N-acetylglucosamine synthase-like glycosyltransferase
VLGALTAVLELVVVLALVWFSARRLLLLAAALAPARPTSAVLDAELPHVTLAIPAHNEELVAHRLVAAIAELEYPNDRLSVVLVCDGCTDGTAGAFRRWAQTRDRARVLELPQRVGKAQALNEALTLAEGEVFVVLDADVLPRSNFLTCLVRAFENPRVAAAAGFLHPVNPASSTVSRYSALNSWAHQLITSAGKDRLDLDPTTLGASGYRTAALRRLDGFPSHSLGEDVDATFILAQAGWSTRFVPSAVAENQVAERLSDYWHQHIRWARAALGSGTRRRRSRRSGIVRQLEAWTTAFDYGDRLAFLGALVLAVFGDLPLWVPAAYFAPLAAVLFVALLRAGAGTGIPRFVFAAVAMFPVDVAASAAALLLQLTRRQRRWRNARRPPSTGADCRPSLLS